MSLSQKEQNNSCFTFIWNINTRRKTFSSTFSSCFESTGNNFANDELRTFGGKPVVTT